MAQYVLNIKGSVVPWRTLCRLRPDEISVSNVTEEQKHYIFDKAIHDMLGDSYSFALWRPDNELLAYFEDVLSEDELLPPDLPYIITGEETTPDTPEGDVVNAAGKQIGEGVNLVEALIGAEVHASMRGW